MRGGRTTSPTGLPTATSSARRWSGITTTRSATRTNVYGGLAGAYIIRDAQDTGEPGNPLGLPAGPYEIPARAAAFGGIDLLVPKGRRLSVRSTPIFGGLEDKTDHSEPPTEDAPTLHVDAVSVFGGVEIKHQK